jgi:hypothetical protein
MRGGPVEGLTVSSTSFLSGSMEMSTVNGGSVSCRQNAGKRSATGLPDESLSNFCRFDGDRSL